MHTARSCPNRLAACFNTILILFLLPAATACFQKPQQIAYLSPLDRVQEGFLDPVTYQIVSYGQALDMSKPFDPRFTFFPKSISDQFNHEEFLEFNRQQQELLRTYKPVTGIPLAEILAAEINFINPQEIDLSAIDEKIRAPMEIKRVLFDNACAHARVIGLYRWLITDVMEMKLLHGATLPRERLPLIGLNPVYFPPRNYYTGDSTEVLKDLDAAMEKKKFRYEIVQEVFSKPEKFECKLVIHIHRRNLQVNMPFLAPL